MWAERLVARPDAVDRRADRRDVPGRPRPRRRRADERERFEQAASANWPTCTALPPADVLKSRAVWKDVAHAMFNLQRIHLYSVDASTDASMSDHPPQTHRRVCPGRQAALPLVAPRDAAPRRPTASACWRCRACWPKTAAAGPRRGRVARTAFRAAGEERHLLLHGRRRVARRFVRPQAEARRARRQAVHRIEEPDGERQPAVAEEPLEVPASTGKSGMPVSELFPHIADVRRRPGGDPLDEGRPAAALDRRAVPAHRAQQRRPAQPRLVGQLRPGKREPEPARLRRAELRRRAVRRAGELLQRLPAGQPPGHAACRPTARRSTTSPPADDDRAHPAGEARPARAARTRRSRGRSAATTPSRRRSRTTRWPTGCSRSCPTCSTWAARPRRRRSCTASIRTSRRKRLYGIQCLRARRLVESGVRFVEVTCPPGAVERHLGPARRPEEGPREERPRHRPGDRRPDQGPEARAACSTRRWSSGPASSAARRTPPAATAATTTPKASPSGWPAAASRAARSTAPPTSWACTPSRTSARCTTCTPRSCTCSASTTSG